MEMPSSTNVESCSGRGPTVCDGFVCCFLDSSRIWALLCYASFGFWCWTSPLAWLQSASWWRPFPRSCLLSPIQHSSLHLMSILRYFPCKASSSFLKQCCSFCLKQGFVDSCCLLELVQAASSHLGQARLIDCQKTMSSTTIHHSRALKAQFLETHLCPFSEWLQILRFCREFKG